MKVPFCSCRDLDCPHHPTNHEQGCTPCIAKNLKQNEVPSCVWRKVKEDLSEVDDFTIDGFVKFVEANR